MAPSSTKCATVEVEGEAGRIIVNKSDLKQYEANGYSVCGGGDAPVELTGYARFVVSRLKDELDRREIQYNSDAKKADLIALLEANPVNADKAVEL